MGPAASFLEITGSTCSPVVWSRLFPESMWGAELLTSPRAPPSGLGAAPAGSHRMGKVWMNEWREIHPRAS